jgi:hypothetical protein
VIIGFHKTVHLAQVVARTYSIWFAVCGCGIGFSAESDKRE